MTGAMAGRKALAVGFTVALVAHLGVIADGKIGASQARAERIKTAVEAQKAATEAV